jgi:hypothetical protein
VTFGLLRCLGSVALGACLLAGFAAAQTPDTSSVAGTIEDANQRPIAGAVVTVVNTANGIRSAATSGAEGHFFLGDLPIAGAYEIRAQKPGFADVTLQDISLASGGAANLRLQMNVAASGTRVVVTGTSGTVETSSPQLGVRLSAQQMQETPLLNRRITYLPLLDSANRPALNQGDLFMNQDLFTSNGTGRRQTWWELDGGNAIDMWGRQTVFTNVPLAAVEQMTVIDNAFSGDYGFGLGSVVNIVTRRGTDALHGEALGLWRPSAPEAKLSGFTESNASNGNELINDTLRQGAASLGGPLPGGSTWYFVSGQASAEDRASPVTSPIAPGNFIGRFRSWLLLARLDRQIGARNAAFLRTDVDRFHDTNPNGTVGGNTLPSVDRIFSKRTYSAEAGDTTSIDNATANDLRLQFQLASPITEFDPVVYGTQFVVPISTGGTFESGTSQSALLMNRQYEANDTVTHASTRQQLSFGVEMIHAHNGGDSMENGGPIYLGKFQYLPCTQTLAFCESAAYLDNIANVQSYTQSYGNGVYAVNDTLWAAFVQDAIRPSRNLTVNVGLRYEVQTFTDARADLSPRVGFSYGLRNNASTVLQGGFGIYYAQVPDNSQASYSLDGPTGVFNFTAGPGQIGFPGSIAAAPLPAFPPGAQMPLRSLYIRPGDSAFLDQFFPTSELKNYPGKLLNPYNEQWMLGVEQQVRRNWVLKVDYVGSHTLRTVRPLDVDPPAPFIRTKPGQIRTPQEANCTRPYWIAWYAQHNMTCNRAAPSNPQPPYSVIQSDVNDGYAYYDALEVNLSHRFTNGSGMLASYTWSHTIDNVDPDVQRFAQNPNDPNFPGVQENGNAIFDQRHRLVVSGTWAAPWRFYAGGITTLASGLPFNYLTGAANSGDLGATADRPVIDGHVVGRNTGRGRAIYETDPFVERPILLSGTHTVNLVLRAEAFNVFNRANFVGYSGTYGNGTTPGPGFGQPLPGVASQLTARTFQFSTRIDF